MCKNVYKACEQSFRGEIESEQIPSKCCENKKLALIVIYAKCGFGVIANTHGNQVLVRDKNGSKLITL